MKNFLKLFRCASKISSNKVSFEKLSDRRVARLRVIFNSYKTDSLRFESSNQYFHSKLKSKFDLLHRRWNTIALIETFIRMDQDLVLSSNTLSCDFKWRDFHNHIERIF